MIFDESHLTTIASTTFATICAVISDSLAYEIVMAVLSVLSVLASLGYTIYKWYKRVNADGKITKDEWHELVEEIKEGTDNE